ncbi:Oidioi.mRNA.OKI2018_I69.chr1.g331.t1.cds [Oikopleura dioica]|uniref:Oidioi.mRNA.OKI2018_I69.chr1.g331.t1.cds n=1 Tax=Oikopleura dioica TaxID=34765 RepID=A0ABN7SJI3_OIKDI|nr:Oidioi.mRNA.OKI2018_I69.chr1.g331.t1.cds [Oikopleura dioica]
MKVSVFLLPFANSCRQSSSVINLKSSRRGGKDDFTKISEKVIDCVLGAKYEENFHEYVADQSEWLMMLRMNCGSVCSSVNSLDCYKCWEQNLISESAFDELCYFYQFENCQYENDFRRFFRKAKNCLSRKLNLNELIQEESMREKIMLMDFELGSARNEQIPRNEIEIPEKDVYFRSFGKCIKVDEQDLLRFLQTAQFIEKCLGKCEICENREEISKCAKCWKNSLNLSSEAFIAFCQLPYKNCENLKQNTWTRQISKCIDKVARKKQKNFNYLLINWRFHG